MLESEIVNKIKDYLKSVSELFFFKEHGGQFGTAGIPDIIICYRGKFIALEVKTESGKTTILQDVTIRKIGQAGGYATVVRSVEDVKKIVTALK